MVQYVGIKRNKSALMPNAWTGETKQVGISFNSRKAIKTLFYQRVRAGDSEMDASINSAENRGVFLALLCSFYTTQGLHKKKSLSATDFHSEVSSGATLVWLRGSKLAGLSHVPTQPPSLSCLAPLPLLPAVGIFWSNIPKVKVRQNFVICNSCLCPHVISHRRKSGF